MTSPIIPWPGGKRRLLKHIVPLIPDHQCYVEAFAGGAALLMTKAPSEVEVLNDINGELVNLYRVVRVHLEEFMRQFKWALVSRQIFTWAKEENVTSLTDIQRAARFYYLQKMAFGGKVSCQTFGTAATSPPKLNLLRMEEDLSSAHLRLSRVYIEHLDWQDVIKRYDRPHTFIFCDPPYWQTAGYGVDFGWENYQQLADLAARVQGKMLITLNDHPAIRRLFDKFKVEAVGIRYTIGGGQRSAQELIIRNW